MDSKSSAFIQSDTIHSCQNCGNSFQGKVCNKCGEKKFSPKQLSTTHFFHQIVDFFTHFENKALKSIWLNIRKPGFITKMNLKGVRVPYANPIQLFIIVSILFYVTVTKVRVTDYAPSYGDRTVFLLSNLKVFNWMKPFDDAMITKIEDLKSHYLDKKRNKVRNDFMKSRDSITGLYRIYTTQPQDSLLLNDKQLTMLINHETENLFYSSFTATSFSYSKTAIFLTLPLIAVIFFIIFFKQLRYFGASLILSTHFITFNLCVYVAHCLINWAPYRIWGGDSAFLMFKPIDLIYNHPFLSQVFTFIFGIEFEFFHLLFWVPWLTIAFKRLFNKPWWVNVLLAFLCGRIFYYLIFGLYKKILILITLWTMH